MKNKQKPLVFGKDWDYAAWDWKEQCPWRILAELQKKFKFTLETNLWSDTNYVFFSNVKLTEKKAAKLLYDEAA